VGITPDAADLVDQAQAQGAASKKQIYEAAGVLSDR